MTSLFRTYNIAVLTATNVCNYLISRRKDVTTTSFFSFNSVLQEDRSVKMCCCYYISATVVLYDPFRELICIHKGLP